MVVLLSVSAKARVVSATLHRMRVRTTVPTRTIISPREIFLGTSGEAGPAGTQQPSLVYIRVSRKGQGKITRGPSPGLMVEFVCIGITKTRASFDSTVK